MGKIIKALKCKAFEFVRDILPIKLCHLDICFIEQSDKIMVEIKIFKKFFMFFKPRINRLYEKHFAISFIYEIL
jgi:hypothetical protein